MPIADLSTLINATAQNLSQFKGLSFAYNLLGGAPSIAGYTALIKANNDSNFGAGGTVKFNDENVYINTLNALYQGNADAKAAFDKIVNDGATLSDKLEMVYNTLIPVSARTDAGLAYVKSQAAFYEARAIELGVSGANGAALVAFAGLSKIAVDNDIGGLGDTVNDLISAVNNGTAVLPEDGTVFTPLETADGTQFDGDDAPVTDPNVGQTFTLTAGADTGAAFTGTNGNDTFNALNVNASGVAATTLSAFDNIDGGNGVDTLNIFNDNTDNTSLPASAVIKNVEIININNDGGDFHTGTAGTVDATKFAGATQIWQIGRAANILDKLDATTTAGLRNIAAAETLAIAPSDSATMTSVAFDTVAEGTTLNIAATATGTLNSVKVSGTVTDTNADKTVGDTNLNVTVGKDVQTLTVESGVATALAITDGAGTKKITSIDGSKSTGAITYADTETTVASLKGGSGNDALTTVTATLKDNAATAADETISAVVEGGAGKDAIVINTTGTGTTTVDAGAGDDTVTLTGDGTGVLTVNLGAGNDTFKGAGAVSGTDVIDGGDGTDSLLLNMVGAANIGAFKNFEVFDAAGLAKTLDVDILAANNTVTEFTASADVGGTAVLTNVGAGVGYRVTGDTAIANAMTLTQKTAGALTVTLDIDEPATTAANFDSGAAINVDAAVVASNATSVKAVFDSAFKDAAVDATDNLTNLTVTGTAATTLEVVSGGDNAINDLVYVYGKGTATANADGLLTGVTISGAQGLTAAFSDSTDDSETNIATVNASTMTGGLKIGLDDLKATGVLTLGSGDDVVTAQTGAASAATVAAVRSISGIEKGTAEDLTIQSNFDVVSLTGAVQAADVAATATLTIKDGLFTFNGAGPATLDAAVALVAGQIGVNEAVVFEYIGNSYIYAEGATDGGADDVMIKLDATVGLTGLDDVNGAGTNLYVF